MVRDNKFISSPNVLELLELAIPYYFISLIYTLKNSYIFKTTKFHYIFFGTYVFIRFRKSRTVLRQKSQSCLKK